MKLGFFTDSHYSSQEVTCGNRYNNQSLRKIRQAYEAFAAAKCDLVISLGDLIDKEHDHAKETENLRQVAQLINSFPIPSICLMGNHDAFCLTVEEFYEILGQQNAPQNRIVDGKQLVFLDACYFKSGQHYQPGDEDWTDTFYPFETQLEETIAGYHGESIVFVHQNLDPSVMENHCLFNAAKIRNILESSGKVKHVFQGHYHEGNEAQVNGIQYTTFPAMCQRENAYFIVEL